ncbi:MAG: hypothetical protein IPP67_04385 [Rhodospirillaceae bacterium]|nr:hypothetical protein [Rhodospirillaceae bacterium]
MSNQLIYGLGYMAGSFMRDGRELFLSADIMKDNPSEFLAATPGYIVYCGRYT